jgi:hypothetical protein
MTNKLDISHSYNANTVIYKYLNAGKTYANLLRAIFTPPVVIPNAEVIFVLGMLNLSNFTAFINGLLESLVF